MTRRKNLKRLVRERMQKTGERYAAARRHVVAQAPTSPSRGAARWHLPGNVPATTALRIALNAAGVRNPATGEPFSEAMLFGLAGGIGAGMFAFYYEQDDFSSFFVAGRHLWEDDLAYLQAAVQRLGLEATVTETGGRRAAESQLLAALNREQPAIAWVDSAHLPHRALPDAHSGGGYHVVSVYAVDDDRVLVGDLADDPIAVPRQAFADARARIKKFKHRVMSLQPAEPRELDLPSLIRAGLQACHASMRKARLKNFTLETFKTWADRIYGSTGKESWDRMFPRGARLWRGLTSVYDFIEHYGTGGGLMRPLFAEFLDAASQATGDAALRGLAGQYAELGRLWSELADAALPDDVPELRQAKLLLAEKAEATFSGGEDAVARIEAVWPKLGELRDAARDEFPLSDAECLALRARLQQRILEIYEKETAAIQAVAAAAP